MALCFFCLNTECLRTSFDIGADRMYWALHLFLKCILGGYFHGRHHLTYGVDVSKMRFLGVLQRISIGYLLASMSEIWLVNNVIVDSSMTFVRKYYSLWMVAVSLCILYVCLLHGLYVPDWEFEVSTSNLTLHGSGTQTECSVNTPDYGPLPPNSPAWCLAPFDPEGILSSMMAAITCFVGLHFGHILLHFKDNMHRVFLWSFSSFPLLISGYALKLLGIPFCKPLYTLSYMCVTAGVSGLCLTAVFYIVDVKNLRKPTILLQWMGMNALIIYALAACDIFPAAVQGVYWRSPENNLMDGTESLLQAMLHSQKWGTLAFVILEIIFWGFIAGVLHMKGIHIKL
ncbi:heparan-alpha-glucosaminide N-acetyltransferase-like [Tripterygium wilfordii]|uniref:Heparan-alpha-glucosaminide N-acetyltransferase-like n=1 Tax=Tripterygium wilfordii TaxID=458696 RepID=A0A7J7D5I4_TRIWF|nr:heparan-alpha-glucosaminide N-acetyltransferase-like [Tripterygium wilfordii]